MPYPRRVRQPGSPAGAGRQLERHSTASLKHIVTGEFSTRPKSLTTVATEIMIHPRISCVVKKPVCTPVPPVAYGSAAGDAGYAPPAFTWSNKATCHPAASGTSPSAISTRRKTTQRERRSAAARRLQFRMKLFSGFGAPSRRSRLRAANSTLSLAQARGPGFDCQLSPSRRLTPMRVQQDRSIVSRPGSG